MNSLINVSTTPLARREEEILKCIFCDTDSESAHIEHIIPESLGGSLEFTLSNGMICNKCNSYFSKIENYALNDFPFKLLRVFLGIKSKKNVLPSIKTTYGKLSSVNGGGKIVLDIDEQGLEALILEREETYKGYFIAEIKDNVSVCKMLLKIGLEYLALKYPEYIYLDYYADAKYFSRFGRKGQNWSFILEENREKIGHYLKSGINYENTNAYEIEIFGDTKPNYFTFNIIGVKFFIPLVKRELNQGLDNSKYRYYDVVI